MSQLYYLCIPNTKYDDISNIGGFEINQDTLRFTNDVAFIYEEDCYDSTIIMLNNNKYSLQGWLMCVDGFDGRKYHIDYNDVEFSVLKSLLDEIKNPTVENISDISWI